MKKFCTFGFGAVMLAIASGAQCNQSGGTATGKLRLLITDKPYPYEWIESAVVTITKVEVRRSGESRCDTPCDDGLYCNGFENCVDRECQDGVAPCSEGEYCHEASDSCRPLCSVDAHCNDAVYCNGAETCNTENGQCVAGEPPCAVGQFCHEGTQTCDDQCMANAECDDGVFCNGAEICDTNSGACHGGSTPECDDEQVCDEDTDACSDDGDDDGDGQGSPFIVIFEGERSFDLLDLQNGRTDLLADADDLPAGSYDQMRVYVTRGVVTLKDGAGEFDLTVPSGASSGIKLHFDFEIPAGGEATLLLDVDLSRAFKAIPSGHIEDPSTIEGFHFTPSVAMRLIDVLAAGSISGTVTAEGGGPLAGAAVTAFDENDEEVASTSTEADGTYLLGGLVTGTYRVEFSAAGFVDTEVSDVQVQAGETTEGVDAALQPAP